MGKGFGNPLRKERGKMLNRDVPLHQTSRTSPVQFPGWVMEFRSHFQKIS